MNEYLFCASKLQSSVPAPERSSAAGAFFLLHQDTSSSGGTSGHEGFACVKPNPYQGVIDP
jgi:hypothetical protein